MKSLTIEEANELLANECYKKIVAPQICKTNLRKSLNDRIIKEYVNYGIKILNIEFANPLVKHYKIMCYITYLDSGKVNMNILKA
jgi:hypothetical protein